MSEVSRVAGDAPKSSRNAPKWVLTQWLHYGCDDQLREDQQCATWAKAGECERNPLYMRNTCRRACGLCGCDDRIPWRGKGGSAECMRWARDGECEANPVYMREACEWSCGMCGGEEPALPGR